MNQRSTSIRQDALICELYISSADALRGYVFKRIGSWSDADDITQDIFAHLLKYTTLLNEKTILNLAYTIARNLTIDYLRRHARSQKAMEYFAIHTNRDANNTEQILNANDIAELEQWNLAAMSDRKAQIYRLCVHEGQTTDEVAITLSLNTRTVENHLFMARQQMRKKMKMCL